MKKQWKALKAGIGLAALLAIIVLAVPIPIPMHKTVPAFMLSGQGGAGERTEVAFTGLYTWRCLGEDTFTGNITLETYSLDVEDMPVRPQFSPVPQPEVTVKIREYGGEPGGSHGEGGVFGSMGSHAMFRRFLLQLFVLDEGWDVGKVFYVAGGAQTYEQAAGALDDFAPQGPPHLGSLGP